MHKYVFQRFIMRLCRHARRLSDEDFETDRAVGTGRPMRVATLMFGESEEPTATVSATVSPGMSGHSRAWKRAPMLGK